MIKCKSCGRVGDDIGKCGSFMTCAGKAGAVEVEPTDVVLKCDTCHVVRVMEAGRIMHGRSLVADHVCLRDQDHCEAYPLTRDAKITVMDAKGDEVFSAESPERAEAELTKAEPTTEERAEAALAKAHTPRPRTGPANGKRG